MIDKEEKKVLVDETRGLVENIKALLKSKDIDDIKERGTYQIDLVKVFIEKGIGEKEFIEFYKKNISKEKKQLKKARISYAETRKKIPDFHIIGNLHIKIEYEKDTRSGRENWTFILLDSDKKVLNEVSHQSPRFGNRNIKSKILKLLAEKCQITKNKSEELWAQIMDEMQQFDWSQFYMKKPEQEDITDAFAIDAYQQAQILNNEKSIREGWGYLSRQDFSKLFHNEISLNYIFSSKKRLSYEFLSALKTILRDKPTGSIFSGGTSVGKSEAVRNALKRLPKIFFAKAASMTKQAGYYLQDSFGSARTILINDTDFKQDDSLSKLLRQISIDDEGCSLLVTTTTENNISQVQRVTLSRDIKAILSTSTTVDYEAQMSSRVDRISVESSPKKIYKVGKIKLEQAERCPWEIEKDYSFRPDDDENWLLKAIWSPLIIDAHYIFPGISKLADYQPLTHARAQRDIDKCLGYVTGWAMLHAPYLTWINHKGIIVALVPPSIWMEGIAVCNEGLLYTYMERDERVERVLDAIKKIGGYFTKSDVCQKARMKRNDAYKIINNLDDDGIIEKIEESRGSIPAKYQYKSEQKREGYFDFSKKIDTEMIGKDNTEKDNLLTKSDPKKELKDIWNHAWEEYKKRVSQYEKHVADELPIPIFGLKLCKFGVKLVDSVEAVENAGDADTAKGEGMTHKKTNTGTNKKSSRDSHVCVKCNTNSSTDSTPSEDSFQKITKLFGLNDTI